jgi:hypothetical protein
MLAPMQQPHKCCGTYLAPSTLLHSHTCPIPHPRRSPVTSLQLGGYAVAFLGVCWYNYQKIQAAKGPARPDSRAGESKPLLSESK